MPRTYKIVQWTTGLASGSYLARTPEEALDDFARDAGYLNFAELIKAQPGFKEISAVPQ